MSCGNMYNMPLRASDDLGIFFPSTQDANLLLVSVNITNKGPAVGEYFYAKHRLSTSQQESLEVPPFDVSGSWHDIRRGREP